MKNSFGTNLIFTIFGESHGEAIGGVLDGMSPGVSIDTEFIKSRLKLRQPQGSISTSRKEADNFKIISGVYNGKTTGTPICIIIENSDTKSTDYGDIEYLPRPSHADYAAHIKYGGYEDFRGGGHFSGRLTAVMVALGAIALKALSKKGIQIGTHISSIGDIYDRDFIDYNKDIAYLSERQLGTLDDNAAKLMQELIENTAKAGDSIGGTLQTAITGVPAGIGDPIFDSVEGKLSYALFGIPAIKGVEFGKGFALSKMTGSEANDQYEFCGKIKTKTNNSGGINGGITNGMPVLFNCAVRPTPSIYKKQSTVDIRTNENKELVIKGRHDPCIVHRARPVVQSVTALVMCDILLGKYGTDYFTE